MKAYGPGKYALCLLLACMLSLLALGGCGPIGTVALVQPTGKAANSDEELDTSQFLVAVEDVPDTVDFQCTSIHYTIATNVFDRLVETEVDANGNALIVPSLAESWEVSDDGRTYTFHLRKGVSFSNGAALTASDVLYTFTRLLTHPNSCNQDIVDDVVGASQLENGETSEFAGIKVLGDYDFTITLDEPFEAFLACLSMPGASIMDEETTSLVGDFFGKDPNSTIGTGPYIMKEWDPQKGMLLVANKDCWQGPPRNQGLDLRFVTEPEEVRMLFEQGDLDILDIDEVASAAEFFFHGDIYQDRLFQVQRIGTAYVALNETVAPLNDVRVRKALQLALNRQTLLDAVYNGLGTVEHGIYPHGLYGFNPDLPEIPYSTDKAKELLAEAGYPDGFDMTFTMKSTSNQWEMTLARLIVDMWEDVGVKASIEVVPEDDFMELRKTGKLGCYTATWTADYDDPDNFVYTFFGSRENSSFRSLCYQREDIMKRVRDAREIIDTDKRIKEYQDLEQIIIQDDAAWIPLFSRLHTYVLSPRIDNVHTTWNGSVKNRYRDVVVNETS